MFVVPINHLSAQAHEQTDARDRKSGHTALTLLKQSRCDYNPVTSTQPCSPAALQAGKSKNAMFQRQESRGHLFCSFQPFKSITDKHTWRGHCQILAIHRKQDVETSRISISVHKLIFVAQRMLTLKDLSSGADFPGFLELIHWSPDNEAWGPKMSCTRKVPVRTQAVCRGQRRIGGQLHQCLRTMLFL